MSGSIRTIFKIVLWTFLAVATVLVALFAITTQKCMRDVDANLQHIRLYGTGQEKAKANLLSNQFLEAANKQYWFQRVWFQGQVALAINHIARACDGRYSIAG